MKETLIEDYVEREIAGARKRVEDAEAVVQQEQQDTKNAENMGLTNREPEKTFQEIVVAVGDCLSDLASSNDGEDGEDEDEDEIGQGKLSEDDDQGWVMGTITKMIPQGMERFRQKQMKFDKLTQPRWDDAANYLRGRDKKYATSGMRVPAVIPLQTDDVTVAPALTTSRELLECLDIVPRILRMPQGTSRPRSTHIRLGSVTPQSDTCTPNLAPTAEPDSPPWRKVKPIERLSFYPCILPLQLITI